VELRVGLQVQPGERHAVRGQELADAEGILGVARSDHAQAGEAARLAQELPLVGERLEDEIAQRGATVEHVLEDVRRHGVHLAITAGDRRDDRRAAGQVRHVAGELAGPMDHQGPGRVVGGILDLDLARLDDEGLEVAVPRPDEGLAGLISLEPWEREPR
jgi:hypothetical protein